MHFLFKFYGRNSNKQSFSAEVCMCILKNHRNVKVYNEDWIYAGQYRSTKIQQVWKLTVTHLVWNESEKKGSVYIKLIGV